jgi:hypothetical protein
MSLNSLRNNFFLADIFKEPKKINIFKLIRMFSSPLFASRVSDGVLTLHMAIGQSNDSRGARDGIASIERDFIGCEITISGMISVVFLSFDDGVGRLKRKSRV